MKYDCIITSRNSGKQFIELQKQTINATIDSFVRECEHYLNDNYYNAYRYLDMNDIRAIAKRMKGEQTK